MTRKRIKGTKYNRVTKQQKYVFLKLCITQKQSIHEAAFNAGIHYSTAKTILFFHKKQYKNYSTYIVNQPHQNEGNAGTVQAVWRQIPIDVDLLGMNPQQVQIVVNSKADTLNQKHQNKNQKDSTIDGKSDLMDVKIQQVEFYFPFQVKQNQDIVSQFKSPNMGIKEQGGQVVDPAFFY